MSFVLPAEPPDADGHVRKVPFANLLVYMRERTLTGTVVFDPPGREPCALVLRRGTPVKALVHTASSRLSEVCLDLKLVSAEALQDTWDVAAGRHRLHGQVLQEYALLDRTKLMMALGLQLERKVAALAVLPGETRFRFFQGKDLLVHYGGVEEPDVAAERLSWVALRHAAPWAHVERALPKLQNATIRLAPQADTQSFGFGELERRVLDALDGEPTTLTALTAQRLLEPGLLLPLLYALLVTKQLELRRTEGSVGDLSSASGMSGVSAMFPRDVATPSGSRVAALPIAPLGAEDEALRNEINERVRTLGQQTFYTLLGVSSSSSKMEVRAAYHALAKRWHPDRLPAPLAHHREDVVRLFALMSEAQQVLTDDRRRGDYDRLVAEGGASLDDQALIRAVVDASTEFQKAEVFLRRGDLVAAQEHAQRAHALDAEQAEHIALLAHLESLQSEQTEVLTRSHAALSKAIELSPKSVKILYYRGLTRKKLGLADDALADFRSVTELDPEHVDAARELRLHQMRSKPSAHEPSGARVGGLFGKLFKR